MHRGWNWFFGAAAAFNFLIGAGGLFAPDAPVMNRIVSLLVFCFGILYALMARDPLRYAPALWAGVIGKTGVVALLLPDVLTNRAEPGLGAILTGDALFTLGFLLFLFTTARRAG